MVIKITCKDPFPYEMPILYKKDGHYVEEFKVKIIKVKCVCGNCGEGDERDI